MFFHKCRQVSRVIDKLGIGQFKTIRNGQNFPAYFLRFIMYYVGRNVVQESGSSINSRI